MEYGKLHAQCGFGYNMACYSNLAFNSLNYNETTTFDTNSWMSIHCYVVENWIKVSILLNF